MVLLLCHHHPLCLTSGYNASIYEFPPGNSRSLFIPHLVGHVVTTGSSANRFPVTAASSGGAFTLLSTNAGRSEVLSVPPHSHRRGYENFFCSKGALRLWLATDNTNQEVQSLDW